MSSLSSALKPLLSSPATGVIVTGGSSGIGLAFAKKVASFGAEVTLVARRRPLLDEAKASIEASIRSVKIHTLELDVAREEDVERVVASHAADHRIDMLVNNAGVVMPGRFLELDGHTLHYVDEGTGPVLLMLHGNPTWSFLFRHLIAQQIIRTIQAILLQCP